MAASATSVRGLKEFRALLKQADGQWPKELAKAHREIARKVAGTAQANAQDGEPVQRKAAPAIKGSGTQSGAAIRVSGGAKYPFADGAFWGALAFPQFPEWVGNTWDAGVASEGPYAINPAIASEIPDILATYDQMVADLFDRAFPDP